MALYSLLFYVIAVIVVAATGLAITRRNAVHAVLYLIISFFGSAMLFYLFGAPFLAALEVIIYAGAIMVLFLFVIMMLRVEATTGKGFELRQWMPAVVLGLVFLSVCTLLIFTDPNSRVNLEMAMAIPKNFGRFVMERYWLSVEIISLLLLIGLVAAIQLGRGKRAEDDQ